MKLRKLNEIQSNLPKIVYRKIFSEADFYGASNLISTRLHLPFTPITSSGWKHGWLYTPVKYIEQITGGRNEFFYLVPLLEHEIYLKKEGVSAKAVGMPFIYVKDIESKKIIRQSNSLLVMPPHTLPYTTNDCVEEDYVKEILEEKDKFDLIVFCLHQSCIKKGLWVKVLEKYKIPWIVGADMHDKNSLIRMYRIFHSFEYMNTNTIGSHVVYAAYCGCKVSISKNYIEYNLEDYLNDPGYKKYPNLYKHNIQYSNFMYIKSKYSRFFTPIVDASISTEWAESQLGEKYKQNPIDMAKILGWELGRQFVAIKNIIYRKIRNKK